MSSRSVSRYFPSKEDIVVGAMLRVGDDVAAALEARPPGETQWEAVRRASSPPWSRWITAAPARAEILATTPSLRAAVSRKQAHWTELLVPRLAARLEGPAASRELQAHAIVAAALACLGVAVSEWRSSGGKRPIGAFMDAAIEAVRG